MQHAVDACFSHHAWMCRFWWSWQSCKIRRLETAPQVWSLWLQSSSNGPMTSCGTRFTPFRSSAATGLPCVRYIPLGCGPLDCIGVEIPVFLSPIQLCQRPDAVRHTASHWDDLYKTCATIDPTMAQLRAVGADLNPLKQMLSLQLHGSEQRMAGCICVTKVLGRYADGALADQCGLLQSARDSTSHAVCTGLMQRPDNIICMSCVR